MGAGGGAVAGGLGEDVGSGLVAAELRGEGLRGAAEIGDRDGSVAMGLVEVWMPKSSSLGEKTIGFGVAVGVGRVAVWVVAFVAER